MFLENIACEKTVFKKTGSACVVSQKNDPNVRKHSYYE